MACLESSQPESYSSAIRASVSVCGQEEVFYHEAEKVAEPDSEQIDHADGIRGFRKIFGSVMAACTVGGGAGSVLLGLHEQYPACGATSALAVTAGACAVGAFKGVRT